MSADTLTLADAPIIHFPESGIAEMPLRRGVNHVLVDVFDSEGRPNTFFLDTGASYSLVTSSFAGSIEERPVVADLPKAVGVAGDLPVAPKPVDVLDMAIGGVHLERFGAVRMDIPGLQEFFGREIHGVLGFNVLRHWLTAIDYRRERLALIDPKAEGRLGWEKPNFVLPFSMHMGAMVRLEGLVNGRKTTFVLDIGSSYTILNRVAGQASGIEWTPDQDTDEGDGAGPSMEVGVAESLVVESLAIVRPKVWQCELSPFSALYLSDEPAAILGNDLLARFRVVIDYGRSELRLWNGA